MDELDWLDFETVMSGIGGVAIGLLFPMALAWWRRRKERAGELFAMRVEMKKTGENLKALLSEQISAPLYRLPVTMTTVALPKLIGEGALRQAEIQVLMEYLGRVEELNRGLDRAGAAHAAGSHLRDQVNEEFNRNRHKARELMENDLGWFSNRTIFDAAEDALRNIEGRYS